MNTKRWLENTARALAHPSRSDLTGGPRKWMWACGNSKGECNGKMNGKVRDVVHGNKEGAMRCLARGRRMSG